MKFEPLFVLVLGCSVSPAPFTTDASLGGTTSMGGQDSSSVNGGMSMAGGTAGNGGFNFGGDPGCDGCNLANAVSVCVNNKCVIDHCISGFTDCNSTSDDGCEINTASDIENCGSCNHNCDAAIATSTCVDNECSCVLDGGTCLCDETFYGDCDSSRENGCESMLNTDSNCGGCGINCFNSSQCSSNTCQCNAIPNYTDPNVISCTSCLERFCCDELNDCMNDATCQSAWNTWESCQDTDYPNCCFGCTVNNSHWLALRSCKINNGCNACGN